MASEAIAGTTRLCVDRRRAAVVSLNFSCAHASHMIALGKLLSTVGYQIIFILDPRYCSLADFSQVGETILVRGHMLPSEELTFDLAVFCNCATGNHRLIRALRRRGAAVLYLFHEPGPPWSLAYLRAEGWKQTVRFFVSGCFNIMAVRYSSGVIVPSSCARAQYEQNYAHYNRNVQTLPLLFDDEIGSERVELERARKLFFGFVGNACRSHGFDTFVQFVKYAVQCGSTIPFAIATRVDLTHLLTNDRELAQLVRDGKVRIQHGRSLTNDEINSSFLACFCVWAVYRRSTQSGVMANAFMAGTPVLATKVGSFPEHVMPGVNGEFVDSICDFAGMLRSAEKIRREIPAYFQGSRRSFVDTFYYGAQQKKITELLNRFAQKNASRQLHF